MMDYEYLSPEETTLLMQEERRREEERLRREAELRQQQMLTQQRSQQPGPAGGIDPSTALSAYQAFAGGSPAAGGISGGAGGAGAGSGGAMSAWPVAVAALAVGQHEWAKKKGLHTDSDALTGRALYKDSEYYQQKGNEKVSGMGDEMRLAAMGSSPADLFRKETWTTAAKLAAKGGILGGMLKKIF